MVVRLRRSALGLISTIFVFLAFVSGAYCQADPNEPNGELGDATAIDIGGAFGGSTSPAGDVDFYKFEVDSPGILEVNLNGVPDEMRTRIDFYGKNFNWIARVDASNPGDLVVLKRDLTDPGMYYLGIVDLAGKSHDAGYSFDLNFEQVVDENEPNGEIGDAVEINFGAPVDGYIFAGGDVDFYKFYVNSTGILDVSIEGVPDDMRTRIDLYGKNFNWITRVDASNPGDLVTLNIDISDPSWYRVGISDLEGKSHNVQYAFTPTFEPMVDGNEPNSAIGDATEIVFGGPVEGIIFPKGDGDFYKLWADIGKLEVELTDSPDEMRARIDLYGKNFNWITRTDASNPGDLATLEFEVASPGWYYIGISDLAAKSHNLGYSFTAVGEGVGQGGIGASTESKLSDLRGTLNTDSNCNLYVADWGDMEVKMINPDGSATTYASGIDRPRYQKFDSAGNLYVGSFDGNIYKISASGEKTVIASGIWSPQDMGFDGAGNLYVAGGYDGKIHRIAPDGSKTAMDSGFTYPKHLAVKTDGTVYVVGNTGTSILRIAPDGGKATLVDLGETISGMATDGEYLYVSHSDKISRIDAFGEVAPMAIGLDQPSSLAVCDGNVFVTVKDGIVKRTIGGVQDIPDVTTTSYSEAKLTHSGFDFSEGTTGEYPTYDGEIISWQSDLMASTHPDYPRDSGYLWWRNLHLDNVNSESQTKDMGAVDISTVRTVPVVWDKSPRIPPLLVGHTIVAKCYDGYVKFQVISVDAADESARVRYSYSADATFDDAAS